MANPWKRKVVVGDCVLLQGDCREILPSLGIFDISVTSPPYNCGKDYGDAGDSLDLVTYWDWLEVIMHLTAGRLSNHGRLCVNHGNYIGSRETRVYVLDELRPILDRQLPFIDHIIWDKGPASGAAWGNFRTSARIRAQHENILVHGNPVPMPPSDIDWKEWSKFTTSIWQIAANVDLKIHPAMMPVEVASRLIALYSPANGSVLDPFMGSGTTGIASLVRGRKFCGIELDSDHFKTACRRIRRAYEDQSLLTEIERPKETQPDLFRESA